MLISLEQTMYQMSQFFLLPTLLLIALLFLFSCYVAGKFLIEYMQRRRGGARPLYRWWEAHRAASDDELDVFAHKQMETERIVTRVAPMMGLVATMIPMGPALKSLSDGNFAAVSENLMVAFSAVILALIAASITFFVVNIRRRWLAEEMLEIANVRQQVIK